MKKRVRLYNLMFPFWLLVFVPIVWLAVLPLNFLLDSLVLLAAAAVLRIGDKKALYKHSILKVWAAGFAADLAGAALLLASYLLWCLADMRGWVQGDAFAQALLTNPWQHPLALVLTLAALALAGWLIYSLDQRWAFRGLGLPPGAGRRLCLALAVLTAPHVYLVPLAWWWGN